MPNTKHGALLIALGSPKEESEPKKHGSLLSLLGKSSDSDSEDDPKMGAEAAAQSFLEAVKAEDASEMVSAMCKLVKECAGMKIVEDDTVYENDDDDDGYGG